MRPISEIADELGIPSDVVLPYGKYKAKIPLSEIKMNSRSIFEGLYLFWKVCNKNKPSRLFSLINTWK